MNNPPPLTPTHVGSSRSRPPHLRSTSHSPVRLRANDDLIANLSPQRTLEALRNPSGALKECFDSSTAIEQAFAIRVAVAARNIEEWLRELSAWPWPDGTGSAGFELPAAKRRRLSRSDEVPKRSGAIHEGSPSSMPGMYMGSLLASEVASFEERIDDIYREMEVLDLEEIKTQVLHNHILPLSRPGTPMSDNRSAVSLSAYAKMDDLTALITATIVQALPSLSKLIRLMNHWSVRLLVLRKTPAFLASLMDGEVALRSGWNAIDVQPRRDLGVEGRSEPREHDQAGSMSPRGPGRSALSRKDFEVIKSILERKVTKAGRDLDRMLDALEGREDTLPDEWIDRMERLERGYGEWVAACERAIREAEYGELFGRLLSPSSLPTVRARLASTEGHVRVSSPSSATRARPTASPEARSPMSTESEKVFWELTSPSPVKKIAQQPKVRPAADKPRHGASPTTEVEAAVEQLRRLDELRVNLWGEKELGAGVFNAQSAEGAKRVPPKPKPKPKRLSLSHHEARVAGEDSSPTTPVTSPLNLGSDLSGLSDGPERDSLATPCPRRASNVSTVSTALFDVHDPIDYFDSDHLLGSSPDLPPLPAVGRTQLPRLNGLDTPELPPSLDQSVTMHVRESLSPPSSPPSAFRSSMRSVSFNDMPTVAEVPDEETPPKTPLDLAFEIDEYDLGSDMGSPVKLSTPTRPIPDDQRLHLQISAILDRLESVPAKIRLAAAPPPPSPAFNYLNPPDFTVPAASGRKASRPDPVMPRSYSSLSTASNFSASSRAGTPSFTLAPAYGRTSRSSRFPKAGNQEIKLYHLSRSNGEAPIKLFIRCVGENGERVMVRVGGGWADLGEYLKEYASHHGRRSQAGAADADKVAVQDISLRANGSGRPSVGSSPPSRPTSAQDLRSSPISMPQLNVRKIRRLATTGTAVDEGGGGKPALPRTPLAIPPSLTDSRSTSSASNSGASAAAGAGGAKSETPPSVGTTSSRSRSNSRLSWTEDEASLGMAGPRGKRLEMTPESKAWVESVKERVRIASGERKVSDSASMNPSALAAGMGPGSRSSSAAGGVSGPALADQGREAGGRFGELGKVGATKRLFRKPA